MEVLRVDLDWSGVIVYKGLALFNVSMQEVRIWQVGLGG